MYMAAASKLLVLAVVQHVHAVDQQGVCLLQVARSDPTPRTTQSLLQRNRPAQAPAGSNNLLGKANNNANANNRFGGNAYDRNVVQFEPVRWNNRPAVLRSHNCYEYMLNDVDPVAANNCEGTLHSSNSGKKGCRKWFHIPGYQYHQHDLHEAVRFNRSTVTCKNMMQRIARDGEGVLLWSGPSKQPTTDFVHNGKSWKHGDHCPTGSYMGSLVIMPSRRFHFYRRDHMCLGDGNEGKRCWSHKPGILNATRFDASGKEIVNLHKADRSYGKHTYTDVCGFFCIPSNKRATTHSDFYRGGANPRWSAV